jgi:hypothetical protein
LSNYFTVFLIQLLSQLNNLLNSPIQLLSHLISLLNFLI